MKCPKCGHEFKAAGQAKGGQKSKRSISPEQQAKMQAARKRKIQSNVEHDHPVCEVEFSRMLSKNRAADMG